MARSAKTNHVMSLVGEKSKGSSPQKKEHKPGIAERTNDTDRPDNREKASFSENPPVKMFNPALLHIEEEQHSAQKTPCEPQQHEKAESGQNAEEGEKAYIDRQEIPPKQEEGTENTRAEIPDPPKESETEKRKNGVTAIVPELINQELEAITKRFRITPTDSNLWQLTKEALETIRPEFSRNSEEYEEKCGRLRQRVILEMTKAAIRISKNGRK